MSTHTDFNDMITAHGKARAFELIPGIIHAAIAQCNARTTEVETHTEIPPETESPPLHLYTDDVVAARPPSPPRGTGGDHEDEALKYMLANYVLIYGTTTVFDNRLKRILTLESLRAALGKGVVRKWQEHQARRIVDEHNVVFDPSETCDADTTVNIFRGFKIKPKNGNCSRLLAALFYLLGEDNDLFDWVIKWTALPLQRPGAKMRTAIVMHGPEGTGKNKFWGAVRDIYGEHGGIITQTQLESNFNDWASGKLFIIGNEVVSRQEMYHHKGVIKNMITEPEWMINTKHLPIRTEANHANFVFFSNVLQPATPDPDDRRLLVIWTPPPKPDAYYIELDQEIRSGGIAALYDFLLTYPLEDFTEYTKPMMTNAKESLIELSMMSHERFLKRWLAGDMPVTVAPILTSDLFAMYTFWCRTEGERFTVRSTELSLMAERRFGMVKLISQKYEQGIKEMKGTFLFPAAMQEPEEGKTKKQWLSECVKFGQKELEDWKGNYVGNG